MPGMKIPLRPLVFLLVTCGLGAQAKYLTIYPQMRSIGTQAPLYLSAFAKDAKEIEIFLIPISRTQFEKYDVDPWSRSYHEILGSAKYDESKAGYKGKFKATTGANYYQIKHGVKAGYYLIVARLDADTVAKSTLLVSDIGIVAKQSESELLLQTVNLANGKMRSGVKLTISSGSSEEKIQLKTGTDGLALLKLADTKIPRDQIRIVASDGKEEAQVFSGQTAYLDSNYQVFIDTDRPIYKGNDKIEWYAVIKRKKKDGTFTALTGGEANYAILSPDGRELAKGKTKISAWGKCTGSFRAPPETGGFVAITLQVEGERHQANVLVKDYVKPSLYVEVTPDQNAVIFGAEIRGKIKSKYLYGAIPEGAEVQYEVYKGVYRKPEFEIRSEEKFFDIASPARSGGRGDVVDQGQGTLDKDGEFEFLVKTGSEHKGSVFTIRATVVVKGSEDREVDRAAGQAQVRVLAGGYVVSLRQDRFILAPRQQEMLRARVLDITEKPAGNQELIVEVLEEKWKTNYGATASAEVTYERVAKIAAKTDADGIANIPIQVEKEGHFQVTATVADAKGNQISESVYYWIAGGNFALSQPSLSELSVQADKRFYSPGETARLLVSTALPDAEILLTAEADRIYEYKVFKLKGNSFLYEVSLTQAHVPNIYISASLVKNGRLITSVLPVFVSPQNRFIKVEIRQNQVQYRPGDTVKMTVKTVSAEGKPVAASVALAVVDEAVYLVQDRLAPSIEKFFYGRRPNRTRLSYSFPQIFTGGASKDSPEPEADRTKFRDTAFFSGNVETNTEGLGSVQFTLPGNLTTWRATGIASDKADLVGSGMVKFMSTKELVSRLSVPRFLNTASSGKVAAIVQNLTNEPLEVEGFFKAKGLTLKGKNNFTATVNPRQLITFEIEVSSDKELPNASVSFFVETKDKRFKDSLEKPLPVHETGLDHLFSSPGLVLNTMDGKKEAQGELVIPVPGELTGKNFRLKEFGVSVAPNLAATMMGSLDYLLEYPHGCVEQTTSRFLPNIEVLRFMKKHKLHSAKLEARLEKHIRAGVQNLLTLQNTERGGWGWWQSRDSYAINHWMTAYALYGLIEAKRAGYTVDEARLAKGIAALKQMMQDTGAEKSYTLDEQDYAKSETFVYFANYILTRNGDGDASVSDAALSLAPASHIESLGWVLSALKDEGRDADFKIVQKALLAKAKAGKFAEELQSEQANTSHAHYNAIAVSALAQDSATKVSPEFITALLANRDLSGKFISTRDTAVSVYAILNFLNTNPRFLSEKQEISIEYPGGISKKVEFEAHGKLEGPQKILFDSALFRKDQPVKITLKGEGLAQVYAFVRGFEKTETFTPQVNGIAVERNYFEAGKDPEKSKFSGSLVVGDAVDVVVKVDMKDRSGNYLFVSESIPPGFTVESDFDYSYGRRNVIVTAEKIYFYAENYYREESFRYRLRAVNPGNYLVPPARAEVMYNDTINGSSRAEVLKVE